MEASEEIGRLENGSSSRSGRPPNPPTAADRTGLTNDRVVVPRKKSLVRHASLVIIFFLISSIFRVFYISNLFIGYSFDFLYNS